MTTRRDKVFMYFLYSPVAKCSLVPGYVTWKGERFRGIGKEVGDRGPVQVVWE